MLANTRETYGLVSQLLHWTMAALILALIPLGLYMYELPASSAEEVVYKSWFYSLHKTLGVSVFAIAVIRVVWATIQPHPKLLNADNKLESLAAQTVHWMLYGAIILMPLTGWLHHSATEGFAPIWWPFSQDLPFVPKNPQLASFFGLAHYFMAILLGFSLALHIGGALKHALIDHDETLQRMLPGRYQSTSRELANPYFKRLPVVLAIFSFIALGGAVVTSYVLNNVGLAQPGTDTSLTNNSTAGWRVDKDNSQLAIQVVQSGKLVSGIFGNWDATINFDPENLQAASAEVKIDVASLSLGNVTAKAISADFLNATLHPVATFKSGTFVSTGDDTYEIRGQLTLAGHSKPLDLHFTLRIENGRAFVNGEAAIKRLEFDIGRKGFSKGDQIGIEVLVQFTIEASRAVPT